MMKAAKLGSSSESPTAVARAEVACPEGNDGSAVERAAVGETSAQKAVDVESCV